MAGLALHPARSLFLAPARFTFAAAAVPFALGLSRSLGWSLQSLSELIPSILLAVPKSKTSHSRKAMRSANKGLKDKQNIVNCPACGSPKLAHHLCPNCYNFLSRMWKKDKNGNSGIPDIL